MSTHAHIRVRAGNDQQQHQNDNLDGMEYGCMRGLRLLLTPKGLPAEPKAAYSVSAVVVGSKPRTCRGRGATGQAGLAQSARPLQLPAGRPYCINSPAACPHNLNMRVTEHSGRCASCNIKLCTCQITAQTTHHNGRLGCGPAAQRRPWCVLRRDICLLLLLRPRRLLRCVLLPWLLLLLLWR